ncbi:hypothetical protein CTEN210_00568 [Chaetoceros tenuissimus]|uniref:Uncharacterized protein n=1 Tax=Chaetoceros tenuissimus TaxID=426638 RepID=A0AAD3CED2_9STRA|nr:hypothetical protein CTEN210_00568 [Chaetoceros tenuissimus]
MNISTFQSNLDFIKSLYFHEEWKDKKCKKEILEALEEANEKIEKAFGESMHRLGWNHKPSFEAVEKVVQKFPSTLSCVDGNASIPIQTVAIGDGPQYVPVLAKQGIKYNVGGEDARGGLLAADPTHEVGWNTLQWLVTVLENSEEKDAKKADVLKQLQKSGLLVKKDIQEQKLLYLCCFSHRKKRFEYLVGLDPDALIDTRIDNMPLIHNLSTFRSEESIMLVLTAAFKHFPNRGGLLFDKDDQGTTVFDYFCDKKGVEKTMSLLYQILSPARDYPILHHIFINAPQHKDIFMKKFPWAYHLKDHNGRTLQQAVLAAGPDIMNKNDMILASLTDNQIQTKDPITTLYPFAAMAVGEHADLEQCYYLLRRQPSVMDKHSRVGNIRRRKRRKLSK